MKTSLFSALILLMADGVRGQGTINFANGAARVNARVTIAGNDAGVEGPEWRAELSS